MTAQPIPTDNTNTIQVFSNPEWVLEFETFFQDVLSKEHLPWAHDIYNLFNNYFNILIPEKKQAICYYIMGMMRAMSMRGWKPK